MNMNSVTNKNKSLLLLYLILCYLAGNTVLSFGEFHLDVRVIGIIFGILLIFILIDKPRIKLSLESIMVLTLYLIFVIFISISVLLSRIPLDSFKILGDFVILFFLLLLSILIIGQYEDFKILIRDLSNIFLVIGIVFAIPLFITFFLGYSKPLSFTGSNVTTRIMFFSLIFMLYRYQKYKELKYLFFTLFFAISIVLVGSRGGLLGAVLYILVNLIFNIKNILRQLKIKPKIIFSILICVLISIPFLRKVWNFFTVRFISTTFQGGEVYTSGRDSLYLTSIDLIRENPIFGLDLGEYLKMTGLYPHNIVLELMVDFGIFGLIYFIILISIAILILIKYRNTDYFPISYLPTYMILIHMTSGSYYDFRYFYLWVFVLTIFSFSQSKLSYKDY